MLLSAWASHGVHVFDEIPQCVSCAAYVSGRVDVKSINIRRLKLTSCGLLLQQNSGPKVFKAKCGTSVQPVVPGPNPLVD